MGIDVHSDRYAAVPQSLLNHLGTSTLFHQKSSMGMSQVMEPDPAYTCLFTDKGKDLRTALREGKTDEDILMLLKSVWSSRADRYSELRTSNSENSIRPPKVEMSYIGG